MPIPSFNNAAEAITYIENTSGLTETDLRSIAAQMETKMPGNVTGYNAALLYSGRIPGLSQDITQMDIAETLAKNSNGQLLTVGQTDIGKLLGSDSFRIALETATGSENAANNILYGAIENGVRQSNSLWDDASRAMVDHISGPVSTITAFAEDGRIYSDTEFMALLNNSNVTTIDGVSRSALLTEYNDLSSTMGETGALAKVRGYVSDVSYAHLHQLEYGFNELGELGVSARTSFFSAAPNLSGWELPGGYTSSGAVSSYFGNLLPRLPSFADTAGFLSRAHVLDALGTAADVFFFSVAAKAAWDAYDNGDATGAQDIMTNWAFEFSGGLIGVKAGLELSAGLVAISALVGLTPPGWVAGGFILAAGAVGGYFGGVGGKEIAGFFGQGNAPVRVDPLVFDLNGDGVSLIHLDQSNVHFDLDNDGSAERVAWVAATDGLLAKDANGNGTIDGISELFGNNTTSGFAALATLDSNSDGAITSADTEFANLRMWQDANQNGVSETSELKTLAQLGITSINLTGTATNQLVEGNIITELGAFTQNGVQQQLAEAHLAMDNFNTITNPSSSAVDVKLETLFMPLSRGYGDLPEWHVAMSEDATLLNMVQDFSELSLSNLADVIPLTEAFLLRWAGADTIAPNSRGTAFDAGKLAFLEKFSGEAFLNGANPVPSQAPFLEQAWHQAVVTMSDRLLVQGPLMDIFPDAHYDFASDTLSIGDDIEAIYTQAETYAPGTGTDTYWLTLIQIINNEASSASSSEKDAAILEIVNNKLAVTAENVDDLVFGDTNHNKISVIGSGHAVFGSAGNDTLTGANGNDTLIGGEGNDSITGGYGDNVIIFGRGDGNDILNVHYVTGETNVLAFKEGIVASDVTFSRSGLDLVVNVVSGESVKVLNYYYGTTFQLDKITFADGTEIDMNTSPSLTLTGTPGDDYMSGNVDNEVFFGNAGNDTLLGGAGNDTLDGGLGNDTITGGTGNNTITFGLGDGNDTLNVHYYAGSETNIVALKAGIAVADVSFTRSGSDLVINIAGGDSITVTSHYTNVSYRLDKLQFADGTQIDMKTSLALTGTSGNDTLTGDTSSEYISGLAGNDSLNGGAGNDSLEGGLGNDTIIGGTGNNVIKYGLGDGNDTLNVNYNGNETNTLVLKAGIAVSDVTFSRSSSDLIMNVTGGGSVKIASHYSGASYRLDKLQFADGTQIDLKTGVPLTGTSGNDTITGENGSNELLSGLAGNDTINGWGGNDTIDGGSGNDSITGGTGNNVITFGHGDGNDTVNVNYYVGNETNTLMLKAGVAVSEVSFSRNSSDLIINIAGGDSIKVASHYGATTSRLDKLQFADGTQIDMKANVPLTGTSGNDTITGETSSNELLSGLAGNDTINGWGGNDTLIGGAGVDNLTGNTGVDYFVYTTNTDSGTGTGNRDIITDFSHSAGDKIDLSAFAGSFTFRGTGSFTGTAIEIRYVAGSNTMIEVDSDQNGVKDFEIQLTGNISLVAGDFVL